MNKDLCKALIQLLKVKSIITIMVLAVFCYLALRGEIEPEYFATVLSAIVTYYFTKKDSGTTGNETVFFGEPIEVKDIKEEGEEK